MIGWANLAVLGGHPVPGIGFVSGHPPADAGFASALDDALQRLTACLGLA